MRSRSRPARALVARFVEDYNHTRLHSAIGYVTPADKLAGRETAIFAARDRKLAQAREQRAARRREERGHAVGQTEHRERLAGVQGAGNEAPGLRERKKTPRRQPLPSSPEPAPSTTL